MLATVITEKSGTRVPSGNFTVSPLEQTTLQTTPKPSWDVHGRNKLDDGRIRRCFVEHEHLRLMPGRAKPPMQSIGGTSGSTGDIIRADVSDPEAASLPCKENPVCKQFHPARYQG